MTTKKFEPITLLEPDEQVKKKTKRVKEFQIILLSTAYRFVYPRFLQMIGYTCSIKLSMHIMA